MTPHATLIKVLIVEDERIVADDIADMLQDAGYAICGYAADGETASQLFLSTNPDVVLMDVQLQGSIDGISLAEQFNALRRIPIIYLTAQGDAASVARAKATQPAAYLLKPFEERGLLIALDIAISNFTSQQAAPHPYADQAAAVIQLSAAKERLSAETILCMNDILFIKQNYKFVKIYRDELLYLEADGGHSYLYTATNKFVMRLSLSQIIERLADPQLVRIHRSYAARFSAIDTFSDTELFINGVSIPIGSAFRESFLRSFEIL